MGAEKAPMGTMYVISASNVLIEICMAGIIVLNAVYLRETALQSHIGFLAVIVMLFVGYYASRKKGTALYIGTYVLPILITYMFFCSKGAELTIISARSVEIAIPYAIIALSLMVIGWLVKQCLTGFSFSSGHEFFAAIFLTAGLVAAMVLFLAWMVDEYYSLGFHQAVLVLSNVVQFVAVLIIAMDHFARPGAAPRALAYCAVLFVVSAALRVIV
jgi:hypothetical protein